MTLGVSLAGAASIASVIAACQPDDAAAPAVDPVDDDSEQTTDEPRDDDAEAGVASDALPDSFEPFETSDLNLDTLQAEMPHGVLQAEAYDNTWVGEVTDDLFIGISLMGSYAGQSQDIAAYLCDGDEIGIYLTGEIDQDGGAALAGDDAEIELTFIDGEFTGEVLLSGEGPIPFSAEEATGVAGLYLAEDQDQLDDVDVVARWVVLADGRQKGIVFCCVLIEHPGCIPCRMQ